MRLDREDLLIVDVGVRYRLTYVMANNNKIASDYNWSVITERARAMRTENRDWWVTGVGYTYVFFFVELPSAFDASNDAKIVELKARATAILNGLE